MWAQLTHRLSAGLLFSLLTTATLASQSQQPAGGAQLGLNEAILLTLAHNPSLVTAGYQIARQEAELLQAGLSPNPELTIATENFAGTGRYSGIDSAETTLSLGWVLERGKRDQRVAAAQAGISLAETEREIMRLDEAAETARLFLGCLSFDARLIQALEAIEIAQASVDAAEERVNRGHSPTADQLRAATTLAQAELRYEDLEHQRLVAMHRLAAQWGQPKPEFSSVAGDLNNLPRPDDFATLLTRIKQTPDHQRYYTEQRLRESEIRLAESNAKPSWRLATGIRRFEFSNEHALVAELTIPLALRNKNQGRVAAARSQLEVTTAQRDAALLRRQTELFAMYQELLHSRHVSQAYANTILPVAEQALAETQRAYAAGRYSFYELSAAQRELLEARASATDAAVAFLRHVIEIERLTGVSLTSSLTTKGGAS